MKRVFINCDITGYITGDVECPDEGVDPAGARNWNKNNTWVQQVIIQNITSLQMNHVGSKTTAKAMYSALSVTYDNMAHQTVNHIQNQLYEMKTREGNNFLKHLDTLKALCDHINQFPNEDFHVSDTRFKSIVSASLPPK